MSNSEERTVIFVTRGLLHDLANLATALDGISNALKFDGPTAVVRAREDLSRTVDRAFELHGQLRSLNPDHGLMEAIDPRVIAAEVARLLMWHVERPCAVTIDEGPAAPVLAEAWRVRRQLLAACDEAAGSATTLRFSFRVTGDEVAAVDESGEVIWSAPTLSAARRLERRAES